MNDRFHYDALVDDALRSVVRRVLTQVAEKGLPGSHHFYISFRSGDPGVMLPDYLRAKYPEEMTIVLQHQYWDLILGPNHFEVTVSFNKQQERIRVPFAALSAFVDPSVRFGLQFDRKDKAGEKAEAARRAAGRPAAGRKAPAAGGTRDLGGQARGRHRAGRRGQARGRRLQDRQARQLPKEVALRPAVVAAGKARALEPRRARRQLCPSSSSRRCFRTVRTRRPTASSPPTMSASTKFNGRDVLTVEPEALTLLTAQAFHDISHLLRPGHLAQLRSILDDGEASANDKYVALELLKNANIAAGGVLPMCQDTGTAIVMGKKGQAVWTGGGDEAAIAKGVFKTYTETNLRYSQVSPISMFKEVQTGTNLPAQIDIYATDGDAYKFLFVAKGGGSANKSYLYQQTPAVLNEAALLKFLDTQIRTLGTAACPPYHLAIVVGGTSAEMNLKTVKLASTRYLDDLPSEGNNKGVAIRDREMEKKVLELTRQMGIGAQFGGKYFCHDVRVIRIARHGASVPIGMGVSCSADRQAVGKITKDGIFLEQLETNPAHYLPEVEPQQLSGDVVAVDLNKGMAHTLSVLTKHPVKTRVNLTGTLIVARDSAHAKLKERLDRGEGLPDYFKQFPVYYAGPAKTPEGMPSGSFGPTTAGRMDSYVDLFQANGGSMVMLAKGNRSKQVVDACKKHKGFYLGSIGGPAAILAKNCIRKVEVLEYPELGMEAIWRIQVENFPAFIVTDDKGNDFFSELKI